MDSSIYLHSDIKIIRHLHASVNCKVSHKGRQHSDDYLYHPQQRQADQFLSSGKPALANRGQETSVIHFTLHPGKEGTKTRGTKRRCETNDNMGATQGVTMSAKPLDQRDETNTFQLRKELEN